MNYLIAILFILSFDISADAASSKTCQFKLSKKLCASVKFVDGISRKSDSKFEIIFSDTKGQRVNFKRTPEIKLWMVMKGGHGHGSEKLAIKKNNNKYLVSNAWFLMMGEWQIKISTSEGEALVNMQDIPVCVGRNSASSHLGNCPKRP
jgi:hypothetical protein